MSLNRHGFSNSRLLANKATLGRDGVGEWILFDDATNEWQLFSSNGSPESVFSADIGSLCTDITNGELYIKTTDTVNTGWVKIGASAGDVAGPGGSTDNAIARFDGTTGKIIQNSNATISDAGVLSLAVDLAVTDGGTGASSLTDGGILLGSGTGAITVTAQPTDGQLLIGSTGVDPVLATLSSGNYTTITNAAGSITIANESNFIKTAKESWNGGIVETAAVSVASDGATITFSVEQSGGGDLTVIFSDGFYTWDTTPADTVTLTAGTDTVPVLSYVYFLQSTKTLTASTVGWPATEHAPLATVLCQSAASLQTDGPYKMHAWTDHITSTNEQGHVSHLNFWIRQQNATWVSGVDQTFSITTNVGTPDNVVLTTLAGVVLQLHQHDFPAFAGTPDVYVVNDSVTPYTKVTDLNSLLTDSTGASMSGKYFSLVIWGVVSEDASDCKLMCNLPSGSYSSAMNLTADASRYANFSIPSDFVGTGFLIAQWNLRHQATSGGTWTSIEEIDLRGTIPSNAAGSSNAFPNEFIDTAFRVFDDGDVTKKVAFQVSGVTTATTRTLTIPDADGTIPVSFAGDAGSATPTSAGVLTIAGGTGVTTSAGTNTVTVNLDSPVTVANGGTGLTSATAYAVLTGGTTGTGAFQSIASVGTSGQVLTSNGAGALPTFEDVTAGGGPDSFPVTNLWGYTHFMSTVSSAPNDVGLYCGSITEIASESGHPGIIRSSTGTYSLYTMFPSDGNAKAAGTGKLISTGSTRTYLMGFSNSKTGTADASLTDGIYFAYTESVSTNIQAVTKSSSSETRTDTGVSGQTTNWVNFKIVGNAAGTSYAFYINDALVATHTTNLPSVELYAVIFGNSLYFNMDYFSYSQDF